MRDNTSDTIAVPGAPGIAGLGFRRFRGPADYPAMLAVLQGCRERDCLEGVLSLEEMARNYEHLTNCDPYQDVLLAEVDGQVVGYGRVWWGEEISGTHFYSHFARVVPRWRGQGIWEALLRGCERRLREIAAAQRPAGECTFHTSADEGDADWLALVQAEGYRPVRYGFLMVRPDLEEIPELPLPEGLEVRPVRPEHYPLILAALDDAFHDNWGFWGFSPEWFAGWQAAPTFDPSLWQVAWAGDEVAGTVLCYIDEPENRESGRQRGFTEYISVRRPWRRRGLARALIARGLRQLRERGMAEAALGVDAENATGALQLYEGMGFRRVQTTTFLRKAL